MTFDKACEILNTLADNRIPHYDYDVVLEAYNKVYEEGTYEHFDLLLLGGKALEQREENSGKAYSDQV